MASPRDRMAPAAAAAEETLKRSESPPGVERLTEEHRKVVSDCRGRIQHWKKVEKDYECLQERIRKLPDKLSYDIMVPFGPLAFMPGKLVHTNEITALLGDNWFAKCSAKQADALVEHRKNHVKKSLDDLEKVMKNYQNRADFTGELDKLTAGSGDFVDIREDVINEEAVTKGKPRLAHKPKSKPKNEFVLKAEEEPQVEEAEHRAGSVSEAELWARLDELERQEELQDQRYRLDSTDSTDCNGDDSTSSSEEEKEAEDSLSVPTPLNATNGHTPLEEEDEEDGDDEETKNGIPTIYFSHTTEIKKVRINTGKNTMLKFSERKEKKEHGKQQQQKKKKKKSSNGHSPQECRISSPADIYRVFGGEPVPRKSILKTRSRENSVCSDTSESSTADTRSLSHDEAPPHSDASDEEHSPPGTSHLSTRFQAFTGTVIEKNPLPSSIPHLTLAAPALPTIPERKLEESGSEAPQEPRRISKFKATRLHQA